MATAKQLAARKLFVQRVRSGEFTPTKKRKANPAKKRAVTKRKPTKRLKARRAVNTRAGYFPNPTKPVLKFIVQCECNGKWKTLARFATKEGAFAYARAYNKAHQVRVQVITE